MIAEIIKELYDAEGKSIGAPTSRKRLKLFCGTFPIERYLSQPLSIQCKNFTELRIFLKKCEYVSDKEQFGREDYWMPPEEFEKTKKGDCDDFALWTWRQLLGMGYRSRYVVGRAGKYGEGHAWVTMVKDGKHFVVEPLMYYFGRFPRLEVARYEPNGSVEWDGKRLHYFKHEKRPFRLPILKIPVLVSEWFLFYISIFFRILYYLPIFLFKRFILRPFTKKV